MQLSKYLDQYDKNRAENALLAGGCPVSAPETRVNAKYGAPMGRGISAEQLAGHRLTLRRVRLNSGGYDAGGAYWGIGLPLYYATDGDYEYAYMRAASRDAAKAELQRLGKLAPGARWLR